MSRSKRQDMLRYLSPKLSFRILLPATMIVMVSFSCDDDSNPCVKGKYLEQYCGGSVIQILDAHNIGKDWDSIFENKRYMNVVLASIDNALLAQGHHPNTFMSADSIFYFRYVDAGYARKQFSNCHPTSFITITFVSNSPCLSDENN